MPKEENDGISKESHIRKPEWLRIKLPSAGDYSHIKHHLNKYNLHTICESGNCPNIGECWTAKTATFMILGNTCSRNCRFCSVDSGVPAVPDIAEPENLAEAVKLLSLKHCVITSVTRDDLEDGGSGHWHDSIVAVKKLNPTTSIEALIPDFSGNKDSLFHVFDSSPNILAHNLETVERLNAEIRNKADYHRSLFVLKCAAEYGLTTKSGIMLGFGETTNEVIKTMDDLLNVDCTILTIGQYLRPAKNNVPVSRYVIPEEFDQLKQTALNKGFSYVESGPLVRSSYHASNHTKTTVY